MADDYKTEVKTDDKNEKKRFELETSIFLLLYFLKKYFVKITEVQNADKK